MILSHMVHDHQRGPLVVDQYSQERTQALQRPNHTWSQHQYKEMPSESSKYSRPSYHSSSPQPPPSPPMENSNNGSLTLPSIHNLIGVADASHHRNQQAGPPETQASTASRQHAPQRLRFEDRQTQPQYPSLSSPRNLPPTPPLHPNTAFDSSHHSPSASSHSSASLAHYTGGAINNTEPQQQRQHAGTSGEPFSATSRQPSQSPFSTSPYAHSPSMGSNYSFSSGPPPSASSMYYQRPLPLSDTSRGSHTSATTIATGSPIEPQTPWPQQQQQQQQQQQHQHHHYISPSASVTIANQQTERYICPTCSKAFSRPSSLRIHSHSHTGEKPFKCPHANCGKAFSVRSNMKRHERGCHGSGSPGSM